MNTLSESKPKVSKRKRLVGSGKSLFLFGFLGLGIKVVVIGTARGGCFRGEGSRALSWA